jgi:voltage-gated potassium channel Kch
VLDLPHLDLASAHARVVALLEQTREVILQRWDTGWAQERGWREYLLGLSDLELERADTRGIAAWFAADAHCPPSLRELAERTVAITTDVPTLRAPDPEVPVELPFTNTRKCAQVKTILSVLRAEFPQIAEIVDVGAGRGQLTTQAASTLAVPALGLERDPERVAVARALAGAIPVRFVTADVLSAEQPLLALPALPHRVLMALHGCGQLGDALVTAAVATNASVLLLGCCPQKIRGDKRNPLVLGGPAFPREVLGLANVLPRQEGVEGDLSDALAMKETRLALRELLAARGVAVLAGEEMRGVNRRKPNAGLAVLAAAACQARALPAPTLDELATATERAHAHYQTQRRLMLPRSMLGRALEIFIALDRALYLQQRGYRARVLELFPPATSPRNIAVLARRE